MRNLVYVPNRRVDVARALELDEPVYRSPKLFEEAETQVRSVVVLDICPNWREIRDIYEAAGKPVEVIEVAAALADASAGPKPAPAPKPRTRKELFAAAKAAGLKVAGNTKTENLRAKVREAEAGQ